MLYSSRPLSLNGFELKRSPPRAQSFQGESFEFSPALGGPPSIDQRVVAAVLGKKRQAENDHDTQTLIQQSELIMDHLAMQKTGINNEILTT